MKCPNCQSVADGAYCAECGTPLKGARCAACSATLPVGARFCTACGRAARSAQPRLPWIVAGASIGALIVVLMLPVLRPAPAVDFRSATGAATLPGGGGMQPPPLTGSVREQADRLFNRIMEARSQGDTEQMAFFLPMALTAYREAEPLDDDGLYHLSLLETAAGESAGARATAERVLARAPHHLLALAAAAEAAIAAGDTAAARDYYQRFLDAFDDERGRQLVEYLDHARILPEYRAAAEQHLGGG
jgi:hypothetical protein